jgi:hypothetical protein
LWQRDLTTINYLRQNRQLTHDVVILSHGYLRAIIDANKKAFSDQSVPEEIADIIGLIEELFSCENWKSLLRKKGAKVEASLEKSVSEADLDEEIAY